MEEACWCIYRRRAFNESWRLVFVLPPAVREEEVELSIAYTNDVMEQEHKLYWMMLLVPFSEIKREIFVVQEKYSG